jgi:anti-anti-sigma factor
VVGLEHLNGCRNGEIRIASRQLPQGIVIEVGGEIDLSTADTVRDALLRAEEAHSLVALDLSKTSFMDSTGLYLIVAANGRLRERAGRLIVVQGPPQVRRLLEVTCVADHVELVEDAAALERAVESSELSPCPS